MHKEMSAQKAVPALLVTQLMAAEVYSQFLNVSSAGEWDLWKRMLDDELDHIAHLRQVVGGDLSFNHIFPTINIEKMRETCDQIIHMGEELFMMRLEGALRLECAELDYGLEGMAARRLKRKHPLIDYPGDIQEHISYLIKEAERYAESRNIGLQIRRLRELFETSLADTTFLTLDEETRARF